MIGVGRGETFGHRLWLGQETGHSERRPRHSEAINLKTSHSGGVGLLNLVQPDLYGEGLAGVFVGYGEQFLCA